MGQQIKQGSFGASLKIRSGDGGTLYCSRELLWMCSEVFRGAIEASEQEGQRAEDSGTGRIGGISTIPVSESQKQMEMALNALQSIASEG